MSAGDYSIGSRMWPGISKLIEEASEVGQVCGKLIGSGGDPNHWDGTNLRHRLEDEIGDLLAAIEYVTEHNALGTAAITARHREKFALFEIWHREEVNRP